MYISMRDSLTNGERYADYVRQAQRDALARQLKSEAGTNRGRRLALASLFLFIWNAPRRLRPHQGPAA
jgi:hypothetical protein